MLITHKTSWTAPSSLGAALRYDRETKGYTRAGFAKVVDVSDNTIAAIESGKAESVTLGTLAKIARGLPGTEFAKMVGSITSVAVLDITKVLLQKPQTTINSDAFEE